MFVESRDYGKVDLVKQQIINLYSNDMAEQTDERSEYVVEFLFPNSFRIIQARQALHNFAHPIKRENSRISRAHQVVRRSMIINIANCVDEPSAALNLSMSDPSFKCYLMDTGLLISLAFKDRPILENDLYKQILLDRLQVNEGMLIENLVSQCLRANGHPSYFYLERNSATRKTTLEIDFLIRQNKKIVPIEVKSSSSSSIKSLERFKEKYGSRIADGIVLHHGELKREGTVVFLPYFMACVL